MGFWREPLAWWIGPVNAWNRTTNVRPDINAAEPTLRFEWQRAWPVTFRDWDSLRSFLTLVAKFTNGRQPELSDGKTTYATPEEFFERPNPLNTELIAVAAAGSRSFYLRLTTDKQSPSGGSQQPCYVLMQATELQQAEANQVWAVDLLEEFDRLTRPMTLHQRWQNRPVVTKRTEAEYYADRRAAKVRWQSWILGIVGGFVGAAAAFYAGFKP